MRVKVGPALDLASLVADPSPEAKHTRTELGVVTDAMLDAITAELEEIRGEKAPEGRWNPRAKRREAPEPLRAQSAVHSANRTQSKPSIRPLT